MSHYSSAAVERAMKTQEVILRAMSGEYQWLDAADILGVSCRTMRRWKIRYERYGYDGLYDRRNHRPSPVKVPMETVQKVLRLYREQYHDYNVSHFHEKLVKEHGITLSYQWVKTALQTAGLVAVRKKRGPHRKRRERRPLKGLMVHCDGSTHGWIPLLEGQKQDLIAFLDDATSTVLDAYLVDEEATLTVMAGLKRIFKKHGIFCSFYTDRGSHFFYTPKSGGKVDKNNLTQIGRVMQHMGIDHIPSYCPQGRGRMERFFGTWQGRLPQELRSASIKTVDDANEYIRKVFIPWHNKNMTVEPRESANAFVPCNNVDLDSILCVQHERIVRNDNTIVLGNCHFQIHESKLRVSYAKCKVRVCIHLDGKISIRYGPQVLGRYRADGTLIKSKVRRAA